ncbi:MAG: VOC family protein [Pseudomonas sp.]|nr:VOC family protein [Pseudomonas sp.]
MIAYAMVGTANLEKAKAFYAALLGEMGAKLAMDVGRVAFFSAGKGQPMFGICTPFNKQAPSAGNGDMVALAGGSREGVDKLYAKAISLGATDEGAPGERMPGFYGAYFRDLDGNKLAFVHIG